jgi:polyvinyl alcohol dehydrogenase (cytochrome)
VTAARCAAQAETPAAPMGTEFGYSIFQTTCTSCHGNRASTTRAPDPAALRQMTPEAIYAALTSGSMAPVIGNKLTDEQKRRVAEALSGRPLGSALLGDAKNMTNQCASPPPLADPQAGPAWNGWGVDLENTRYQTAKAAGLTAGQVPRLKVKWAFGFPGGVSAYGQPTIVGGRVFVASDNGYVYSLDARTGCVYWSFQAKAAVRNAITIALIRKDGSTQHAAYFGDLKANVYAVDAANGSLLWTRRVEDHVAGRVTGAPAVQGGRVFVSISAWEGFSGSNEDYPCCTFRGSVLALDANTGRQLWKRYMIPEEPKPVRKNSKGTQLWAPGGVSVWSTPTVDVKRHAIYFGTGDAETEPVPKYSDAIMALDMRSGKILWSYQGLAGDAFLGDCAEDNPHRSENCPKHLGPDWDFGASPILRTLPNGHRILVAGQKSGTIFGFDPDRNGALVWKTNLLAASDPVPDSLGLIVFGGAADEQNVYFALHSGGMVALRLATGERVWFTPLLAAGRKPTDQDAGQSAAISAIPGVVFSGGFDGRLHALATDDGRILWQFNTAQEFQTVNGVRAHGGGMGSAGPVIVGGTLFVGSGYAVLSGAQAGNVLLAFSAE